MDSEREYFIAGGKDLEIAKSFIEKYQALSDAQAEFAHVRGGKAVGQGGYFSGIIFPNGEPIGWVKKGECEGVAFFRPARRKGELKQTSDAMDALRVPGCREFHREICGTHSGVIAGPHPKGGARILYASWEWAGETMILSIPVGAGFAPDGSTPLKMSEYWALREKTAA